MTIGMPDYTSRPENFLCLLRCRDAVCKELDLSTNDLDVSMGMSGDFEQAVCLHYSEVAEQGTEILA